jgi:[ribosomal protein S5]-alanine N-acetyltransferase
MKTLETKRLILRSWTLEDLDDFYEYAKHPEVGPSAGWKPHEDKDFTLIILKSFIEKDEVWAIVNKENGKVIGSLGTHNDSKRKGVNAKMIGYVLSKNYWGQGLMTEAVKKALEYLFIDKETEVVSCYHYPFNMRSKKVIEKSGFKFEGVLRNATTHYNGEMYDDYCYSIIRQEYI